VHCREARENLTALADGALAPAEAETLRAHVGACGGCGQDLAGLEATVTLSRHALAEDLPALRPGFDTRLRALLVGEASPPRLGWWRPLFASTLAAVAVLLMARSVGGPSAVLVPLGIQAPPPQVAERAVLFTDYDIIEHLDELEHFETVIQVPLEPEITGKRRGAG
jgi:anti-sigma factor RsiW